MHVNDSKLVQLSTLPTISSTSDVESIAVTERARLRVTIAEQFVWTEPQARGGWRAAIEAMGVFVYLLLQEETLF